MKDRIISVDVLRGFTVLMMTVVNNPGSWSYVYPILDHAKWNGCTLADLVFPFFIFILGIAIPLAMPVKKDDSETVLKIVTRSLRIFCLGLFLSFFYKIQFFDLASYVPLLLIRLSITALVGYALLGNFSLNVKAISAVVIFCILVGLTFSGIEHFDNVRLLGVLQRIGIVYLIVSLLYVKTTIKWQIILSLIILLGYWALMTFVNVPGVGYPNLEPATNFASWLDSVLLEGHMYVETKTWDPEGVLSTVPVIANGLLGVLAGQLLNSKSLSKIKIAQIMAGTGVVLVCLGLLWSVSFPINKSIWSSSYVLFTSGIALFILSIIYYLIDILSHKKWTTFFVVWGVNPMIVFFLSGILPRAFTMIKVQNPDNAGAVINIREYAYTFWISSNFENQTLASLMYAVIYVLLWSCLLWYFYKKKMFFKV
ncbi:acyltransferase family protein [Flavobacterium sp. TMP13]|uniref:acyltransferase family protein n=1 Tax=Flavobacterium sp. TMP13 TaxID=3425950 RepID=UPI003D771550